MAYKRNPRTTRFTTRGKQGGKPWSRTEIAFLRKFYRNNETTWVARQLGRTAYSVRYKASCLSIRKSNPSNWKGNRGVAKTNPNRWTRTPKTRWARTTRWTPRRTRSRRPSRSGRR